MRCIYSRMAMVILSGLLITPLTAAPVPGKTVKPETPATSARKALDDVGDYHFQARSLIDVVAELKDRTRINIMLDPGVVAFGIDPSLPTVNVEMKQARLRDFLKATLATHGLRVGIVREGLYISHDEGLTAYQLRQLVTVDFDGTAFDKAIAALAAETGANLVVDSRLKAKAAVPVQLKLEEVPLETAIRLLAEMAELRAVRSNNVMFITSADRAAVLRQDADGPIPATQPTPGLQQLNLQNGLGGVGIAVPAVPVAPPVVEKVVPEKP